MIQSRLPHHVTHPIANLQEDLNDVIGEGIDVQREGSDFGDMSTEGPMDATAFNAQDNTEVDRDPFNLRHRSTVGAPIIALVGVPNSLKQLRRVFLETMTITNVAGSSPNCGAASHIVTRPRRCAMLSRIRGAFARQDGANVTTDRRTMVVGGKRGGGHAPAFYSALQGVIDGAYPVIHVLFRGCLVNALVLRGDDLKAKSPLCIPGFSHRSHPKINRIHVQVELLLPIAVLGQFALV